VSCYHPITLYPSRTGPSKKTGKTSLVGISKGDPTRGMFIPCGRCTGCRLEYSRQWAIRCYHESKSHTHNSFLTLTLNEESLTHVYSNTAATLNPSDLTLFFKRLRQHVDRHPILFHGDTVRYYACGEYGDESGRPHYHACIFGLDFKDKTLHSSKNGFNLYRSDTLNNIWGLGNCLIGDVTFESAAYVARYVMKKLNGPRAVEYQELAILPEFVRMSRRPGIGQSFYQKYHTDMYSQDTCIVRKGVQTKPPKYYDKLYDLDNPLSMLYIKAQRQIDAFKQGLISAQQLNAKEVIKKAQMSSISRSL